MSNGTTTATTTTEQTTEQTGAQDPREVFAERLLGDALAGLETFAVHLGLELGLYRALEGGPLGAAELAEASGVARRYAEEWLHQQAAAGVVLVERALDGSTAEASRRYALPRAHAEVLLEGSSPFAAAGVAGMLAGTAEVLPALRQAFRTGAGVPYAAYGPHLREGIAALNRPTFETDLPGAWLDALPDVRARLSTGPARVLDLGCGEGVSTTALAAAFPAVTAVGVDLDRSSVERARRRTADAGLEHRVAFRCGDAAAVVAEEQPFDLVLVLEALHDMGDPVGALRCARAALADGGVVLVADERVADELAAPGDFLERFNLGWSVLHCLPATLAEDPVEANGTALRRPVVRRWAAEAGLGVDELDVDHGFWRVYRMEPLVPRPRS